MDPLGKSPQIWRKGNGVTRDPTQTSAGGIMRYAFIALATALALGLAPGKAAAQTPEAPPHGIMAFPWIQPPPEFKEMQRKGFHAGVEAAVKDYDHHHFPDYNRRKEYRHPHVEDAYRTDYRQGFRRGYNDAMHHLEKTNGNPG